MRESHLAGNPPHSPRPPVCPRLAHMREVFTTKEAKDTKAGQECTRLADCGAFRVKNWGLGLGAAIQNADFKNAELEGRGLVGERRSRWYTVGRGSRFGWRASKGRTGS